MNKIKFRIRLPKKTCYNLCSNYFKKMIGCITNNTGKTCYNEKCSINPKERNKWEKRTYLTGGSNRKQIIRW